MRRKQKIKLMPNKLTDEIHAYMKREGINQKQLAERINVSPSTISRILRKGQSPTVETLDKMAAAMGQEVMELVYWSLGRPLPDVYEMARRAYALGSSDRAALSQAAMTLLEGEQHLEPQLKSVKGKPRKNVR